MLARLEDIALWSEAVRTARCEGPISRGVGAERVCELAGGVTITERWLVWEETRSFTYEGRGLPLVASATNTWSLQPEGERTLLVTDARVKLKLGRLGRMLEPLFARQAKRLGARSLAASSIWSSMGGHPG